MSGRSRKGDQLLAKEVPKSELGLLPTIRFVSGGQELMAFDEKYYPVSKTGLYQDLPNRFLATDGYVYSIELDEEVSPPVFRTSNRTYIYEAFTIASKGGILFDTLAGAYPIFREALKGSWQLLWEINSRIADIYNGLEHQIEIEVEVPESFSANLERRAAVMEKLVKSMPSFKRFVQKNQIRKLIYSFKEGASSFSDGVLTIRSEELELSE
jgi:hypothetical protein